MKTPCIAACKNNGGICNGCHRTIDEIISWRHLSDNKRETVIQALQGSVTSHLCPSCGQPAQCDISAGKSTCWCFSVEQRDISSLTSNDTCLCRKCLNALPIV
ncbi:cysteine-rich CWC family protein [Vibrio sp. Isolate24]|uniref:cysteine-rich CWC family protein n=1 Tax=Vibrio sp. Isolate24 TaxID=2908534 RepID=UPI001EFCD86A|nr:cysteine-rich CWC family protein [Vibrio sp. Isolate24]MCG9677334.1 cysteine-rich CWC family protein [Vibrio sp. Isolate24]